MEAGIFFFYVPVKGTMFNNPKKIVAGKENFTTLYPFVECFKETNSHEHFNRYFFLIFMLVW